MVHIQSSEAQPSRQEDRDDDPFVYTTKTDVVYSSAFEHRPLAIPSETGVEPDA